MRYQLFSSLCVVLVAVIWMPGISIGQTFDKAKMYYKYLASGEEPPVANERPAPSDMPLPERKHLEQLRMFKLLEFLDLEEGRDMEFITAFSNFRREQRRLTHERMQVVNTLADGLGEDTLSDKTIYVLTDEIKNLDGARKQLEEQFYAQVKGILTAEQFGKFTIFQEKFELELLEGVRSFRDRRGKGWERNNPGPGNPGRHRMPDAVQLQPDN